VEPATPAPDPEFGPGAAALPPQLTPTREYRAQWTFGITAIFGLVVTFLASGAGFGGNAVGLLLGPVLSIVVFAIAAATVSSPAGAGRQSMDPLLQILIVEGVISVVLAIMRSTLLFPVGAILAWWSLRAAPSAALGPLPPTGAGGILVVGAVLSAIFTLLSYF
jgi:hypothetical protein